MATKNKIEPTYGYTIADDADKNASDQSGDSVDINKLKRGEAQLVESSKPDRKAMRYISNDSLSEFLNPKTGAGRGIQGGPTAKQASQSSSVMSESEKAARKDAAEMKTQERTNKAYEDASKGMKKGGSVSSASSRADGIAQRGKTRGTFIMCGGGMTK